MRARPTSAVRRLLALPGELPDLLAAFQRDDLFLYASAISFQVLTAVVPLALLGLGLLAFLDLSSVYESDLRGQLSDAGVQLDALARG